MVRLSRLLDHVQIGMRLELSTRSIRCVISHFHTYGTILHQNRNTILSSPLIRNIYPDGHFVEDSPSASDDGFSTFSGTSSLGEHVPRSRYIDEPNVISEVRISTYRSPFHSETLVMGNEDPVSNCMSSGSLCAIFSHPNRCDQLSRNFMGRRTI